MKLPRILSEIERVILISAPDDCTSEQIWSRVSEVFGGTGTDVNREQVWQALDTLSSDGLLGAEAGRWFMTDSGWEGLDLLLSTGWGFAERAEVEQEVQPWHRNAESRAPHAL